MQKFQDEERSLFDIGEIGDRVSSVIQLVQNRARCTIPRASRRSHNLARSQRQMTQALISTKSSNLYDCDFLLWTEETIAHLDNGDFKKLDINNLI